MPVDIISNGQAFGTVAQQLLAMGRVDPGTMRPFLNDENEPRMTIFTGGDPTNKKSYRTIQTNAATLRRDEWKRLDDALVNIVESRLNGVQDLISRGLIYNLGNGFGTTILEWHDVSDALEAALTMDGVTRGNNDRVEFQHNYLPLPIIHVDWEINARVLASSRNMGRPLDTTMMERSGRKIAERLENMLFTDTTYSYGETDSRGRNTIYSYINHPDRNTVTLSVNWDDSAKSARDILDEVLSMKQTAINAHYNGPFMLYIPTAYETIMDEDYEDTGTSATGVTVRQRIKQIGSILDVKVVDTLPANNVLLVQMSSDVVRLVRGMPVQNVQWGEEGNMVTKYKSMTIQVPQIRSDANGASGIVHLSA